MYFLIVAEIMGCMIRNDNKIKGTMFNNKEYKLGQYVDDTRLYLCGKDKRLRDAFQKHLIKTQMPGLTLIWTR